jgi:hypothetical protein
MYWKAELAKVGMVSIKKMLKHQRKQFTQVEKILQAQNEDIHSLVKLNSFLYHT